jgi:hypothetical protein
MLECEPRRLRGAPSRQILARSNEVSSPFPGGRNSCTHRRRRNSLAPARGSSRRSTSCLLNNNRRCCRWWRQWRHSVDQFRQGLLNLVGYLLVLLEQREQIRCQPWLHIGGAKHPPEQIGHMPIEHLSVLAESEQRANRPAFVLGHSRRVRSLLALDLRETPIAALAFGLKESAHALPQLPLLHHAGKEYKLPAPDGPTNFFVSPRQKFSGHVHLQ